jgi:transposase
MNNNIINLYDTNHQLVLPIETEIIIPKDDSVRLLNKVLEGLDYSTLYKTYSTYGRNPAISPKTLFKILIYANLNDIQSSRDIEKACRRDINFMWLLQGQSPPDYSTICRFRKDRLKDCIEDLFYQFVVILKNLGEVQYKTIFIDGTKIEANANKYTFVWKKSISKFEAKLLEKIKEKIKGINELLKKEYSVPENKLDIKSLETILNDLKNTAFENKIDFVYGKGKRKTKLQVAIEEISDAIEKQRKYDKYNSLFDGRNSFSKTDTDATFMHLKEDHMRNSQLKPAYNVQIGVEAEYIVGVDISSERSDQLTLIPFLDKMNTNLPEKYENIVADAGYESEENYLYLEENNQKTFIKPQAYEKMKTKKFKKDISKRENMQYDNENDEYICTNNKRLRKVGIINKTSKSGYKSEVTVYESESCQECTYKSRCTKAKGNKRLQVSKKFIEKRAVSLKNITTEEGILLRLNRSIQVEGAFGVLKEDHKFRSFLLRGTVNVKTEFLLKALSYNINKLHNKTIQNRNGMQLHKKSVA